MEVNITELEFTDSVLDNLALYMNNASKGWCVLINNKYVGSYTAGGGYYTLYTEVAVFGERYHATTKEQMRKYFIDKYNHKYFKKKLKNTRETNGRTIV